VEEKRFTTYSYHLGPDSSVLTRAAIFTSVEESFDITP